MIVQPLTRWPDYFPRSTRRVMVPRNAGPKRALPLDEQLEIQRALRSATPERRRRGTARELAARYGVSPRTVYRYARAAAPTDQLALRTHIAQWAAERQIRLTHDDVTTLVAALTQVRGR